MSHLVQKKLDRIYHREKKWAKISISVNWPLNTDKSQIQFFYRVVFRYFQDIQPRWQTAASDLIVSVGKKFKHEVMSELLENLVPGTIPHYFVVLTLANFAQADGKCIYWNSDAMTGTRTFKVSACDSVYLKVTARLEKYRSNHRTNCPVRESLSS